ncbi:MAG: tetratricopeptide repeat protein [Candidatus Melainabacteria bacterium]|nr:tetratricopeptide repeat protein [Candidatus Melainabacteria bacterium]
MNFNISGALRTHTGRHKLFIGSVAAVLVTAMAASIYVAIKTNNDREEATELMHSGLNLLAEGKVYEGLNLLESAQSKSPQVCQRLTNNWGFHGNSWNKDNLPPELALKRLDGIKVLRKSDQWIDGERIKLLKQLKRLKPVTDYYETIAKPWCGCDITIKTRTDVLSDDGNLANLLWQQNRKAEAMAKIDRAVALFPWNTDIRELATKIYKDQNQPEKLKLLQQRNLSDEELLSFTKSANDYTDSTNKTKLKAFDKLLNKHSWCAAALLLRSKSYEEANQPGKAIEDANRVIAIYPDLAEGYYRRGEIFESVRNYQRASDDFLTALKTLPNSETLQEKKFEIAEHLNQNDVVLRLLDEKIKSHPNNLDLYKDKSELLKSLNRWKLAERVINEAIPLAELEMRCDRLVSFYEVAEVYDSSAHNAVLEFKKQKADLRHAEGDTEGAIEILDKLIKTYPADLSVRDLKIRYLVDSKKYNAALASMNETMALQGPSITIPIVSQLNPNQSLFDSASLYELPRDGSINNDAVTRLATRAEIYKALKDKNNELKDRREKLHLERLDLNGYSNAPQYLNALSKAIDLPDKAIATNVLERFLKKQKTAGSDESNNLLGATDISNFCREIEDTDNHALAIEILNRLDNELQEKFEVIGSTRAHLQDRL